MDYLKAISFVCKELKNEATRQGWGSKFLHYVRARVKDIKDEGQPLAVSGGLLYFRSDNKYEVLPE